MRLQEIYSLVSDAIDRLSYVDALDEQAYDTHYYYGRISLIRLLGIVKELEPLKIISPVDIYFIEWLLIPVNGDFRPLDSTESEYIHFCIEKWKCGLLGMREICKDVGAKPDIYGFSVKLPPNITLKQLSCCAKDLDTIFSQCPILRIQDGAITLSGVDIGSAWLTFIIAGSSSVAILGALAAMIDKIIQIRSHLLTLKEQEEELVRRRISNDIIKEMASVHKKIAEQISQNAVESLASSYDINCPEELQRLKYSMELLSDWMEKGIEIYASVGAPQEIKALFPSVEQQKLVTQLLKELRAPDGCESQNKE